MIALYSENQGKEFISFARKVLESYFTGEKIAVPDKLHFRQARGVYVFLTKEGKVRGRYGFPKAGYALGDAISRAIIKAAFADSKFPVLRIEELKDVKIEIHVLNEPTKVIESVEKELDFGNEGLICKYITYTGFLLPNIIHEKGWNKVEFIEHVCQQAGLPKDYWQKSGVEFWRIRVQSFKE